jgi:hypothetical protein
LNHFIELLRFSAITTLNFIYNTGFHVELPESVTFQWPPGRFHRCNLFIMGSVTAGRRAFA